MKKKGMLHLVATNKGSHIIQYKPPALNQKEFEYFDTIRHGLINHHLYITTEEEIKEGLEEELKIGCIFKADMGNIVVFTHARVKTMGKYYKILATDNPELWSKQKVIDSPPWFEREWGVAKIPLSFLKEYVEKQPKEVWLEYDWYHKDTDISIPEGVRVDVNDIEERLKLNSSGEVIISPVEERMYTREQVRRILGEYNMSIRSGTLIPPPYVWFDKNYPQ